VKDKGGSSFKIFESLGGKPGSVRFVLKNERASLPREGLKKSKRERSLRDLHPGKSTSGDRNELLPP